MIPTFRKGVLVAEDKQFDEKNCDNRDNLLYALKKLFLNLVLSTTKSVSPRKLCYAFKDIDG